MEKQVMKMRRHGFCSEIDGAPLLSNIVESQEAPLALFWVFCSEMPRNKEASNNEQEMIWNRASSLWY